MTHVHGVILDVDGTLVDSNDAHAHSWLEAMAEYGYHIAFEKVRPLIGMGGDKVLPLTIGVDKDSSVGQKISKRRGEIFKERYLSNIHPFPHAQDLLNRMRERGLKLSIASSAKPDELKDLLQIVGAADLIQDKSSEKDTSNSKPSPDVISITLQKIAIPPDQVLMIGDTSFDIESAKKVCVDTIAFRCGGSTDADLAGAIAIYNDPADLLAHYDSSPLGQ